MADKIKIFGTAKIYDKTVLQVGTPPIDYDTILLEDESGYMTQEVSGEFLLEFQN
jgi:hypothetical protein